MTKLKCAKYILLLGKILLITGLVLIAIRDITIEVFEIPIENDFTVPAGSVMEPNVKDFSFAVASDTGAKDEQIEEIIEKVADGKNRFMLYLGDLVRYKNISHFNWMVTEMSERAKLPIYMIPGNHEVENVFHHVDKSSYRSVFGQLYYWFSYGEVMFIGLDSSEEKYSNAQLEWLENIMDKIRPEYKYCIVYTHVPPMNSDQWIKKMKKHESVNRLGEILVKNNIDLILSGHVHTFSKETVWGIPLVTVMSSGQPIRSEIKKYGYVTVEVSAEGIGKVEPHYLDNQHNKKTEYVERFFSSTMADDRMFVIALSLIIVGLVILGCGFMVRVKR